MEIAKHWYSPILSRVIALETEITKAVMHGHKATDVDEYQEKRKELKRLREELKTK